MTVRLEIMGQECFNKSVQGQFWPYIDLFVAFPEAIKIGLLSTNDLPSHSTAFRRQKSVNWWFSMNGAAAKGSMHGILKFINKYVGIIYFIFTPLKNSIDLDFKLCYNIQ